MDEAANDSDIDEPVVVYSSPNEAEAEIVKNALTAEGIRCSLAGKSQGGFAGLFAVNILVRAWDEDRARQVIGRHRPRESGFLQ